MMAEILEEDESRVRWSHDNGKTWEYADIDELIAAYEKEQEHPEQSIAEWQKDFRGYINMLDIPRDDYRGIMEYINEVPSAQPERG